MGSPTDADAAAAAVKAAVASTIKEQGLKPEDFAQKDGTHTTVASTTEEAEPPKGKDKESAGDEGAGDDKGKKAATTKTEGEGSIIEPTEKDDKGKVKDDDKDDKGKDAAAAAAVAAKLADEDLEFKPTAEDLAVIDKSPELKKVYRSMVRAQTEKTTKLADLRKESEAALAAVKAIREDPAKAVRALAAAVGIKIVEDPAPALDTTTPTAEATTVAKLQAKLEAKIGKEAAEVLAPVLLDAVASVTGEELGPIKDALAKQDELAEARALKAGISDFGLKIRENGGEWDESVEKEMSALVGDILPGKGMTLPKFLGVLYNNVQATRNEKATKEAAVERLRKAAENKEPIRQQRTTTASPKVITPGMDPKEAVATAVELAKAEIAARG